MGGWSTNVLFTAQSGNYFTVWPSGISTPDNIGSRAVKVGNAFSTGGTAPNSSVTCPTSVKNHEHWFNPCAFKNPWNASGSGDHPLTAGNYVTDVPTLLGYIGGRRNAITGPGFERVNMSIFKSFNVFKEDKLDFRADIFNVLNTPALANPSDTNINANAGQITGVRSLQRYSPDSRFIQLSLRFAF